MCAWIEIYLHHSIIMLHFFTSSKLITAFATKPHLEYVEIAFDTDSIKIGVDTCALATMSGNLEKSSDLILQNLGKCKGVGGKLVIADIGTFHFKLDDDNGWTHIINIPNSIYVPNLQMPLLCPQHWAQQCHDSEGAIAFTMADAIVLVWGNGNFCKTILQNNQSNTPTFYTSPSINLYHAFCATIESHHAYTLPPEIMFHEVGSPHQQCQREAEMEFMAVKDLLVGTEDELLVINDDWLKYKPASLEDHYLPSLDDAMVLHSNKWQCLPEWPMSPS